MASYDWREVWRDPVTGENQPIPPGLEIIASFDDAAAGGAAASPTLARIPRSWRLSVAVANEDSFRIDVTARTTLGEIQAALLAKFPRRIARPPPLEVDGRQWTDQTDTVARALLFGAQVRCCLD